MEVIKDIVRQNSLYKLGLSDKPKVLDILEKLNCLKQFKDDEYTNLIFWGKSEDDIYIQQNLNNDIFYISSDKIWSVLESDFGLNYTDIRLFTGWYIETAYDLKVTTTEFGNLDISYVLKLHLI